MKKGILLIVLLAFAGQVVFGQTTTKPKPKPKAGTASTKAAGTTGKKPVGKTTVKGKKPLVKGNTTTVATKPDSTAKPSIALTSIPLRRDTTPVKDAPLDGFYVKTNTFSARPTPYAPLREADVVYEKTIWREIDLRDRVNTYLMSPKKRLIDVLVNAIKNDELTAYDPTSNPAKEDVNGDRFKTPLTKEAAMAKLADSSLVKKFDPNTGAEISAHMVAGEFNPDSILKFRIKEVWMFDKQRSVFEPRILGIAPMVKPRIAGAGENDYQPAFWLYYPEARKILATEAAELKHNDATGLSFDQVFLKRIFYSYIVKESNEKDERIKDYANGIDKLYEAERIKKSLMDWELSLWQY